MDDKIVKNIIQKFSNYESHEKLNSLGMLDDNGNIDKTFEEVSTKNEEEMDASNSESIFDNRY